MTESAPPDLGDEEWRVLQFLPPMPLTLYGALVDAIGRACEREGYEAFFREVDGLGVVHVRRTPRRDR